ncbi:hypothetical protein, partial [Propionispora sp. 2/2-37]|uniref:hypothetical protein n=1 Tax=Propionispora sp. 2/2-37 TaxID=1677858 RepID=UPI0012E20A92
MDSNNNNIQFALVFKGIQEAIRDIQRLKTEMDKLGQKDKGNNTAVAEQLKKDLALTEKVVSDEVKAINDKLGLIGKQNADASKQYWKDEEEAIKRRSRLLQSQMEAMAREEDALNKERLRQQKGNPALEAQQLATAERLRRSQMQSELEAVFNPTKFVDGYRQAIASATAEAEKFHRLFKETGNTDYQQKSMQSVLQVRQLTDEYEKFNKTLGNTPGLLSNIGSEFKRHLGFTLTGLGVGAVIGGIYGALSDISKLDEEFNQLKTVLPQTEANQETFNQAIEDSFHLAQKYGTAIKDVTDSLRLMGRGYHDLSQTEKLSEVALKLGVADNFNPELATRTIEGVVGAYGKQAEAVQFATHVMDAMTKVSHT